MSEFAAITPTEFSAHSPHGLLYGQVWKGDESKLPLLMLHDSLGAVSLWRDFPQQLAQATGRTVVAYDRSGFGRSVVRREPVAASFIADEAYEGIVPVMQALGLERVILLGHSVGGGMSLAAAAALGAQVAGVVTMAAQTFVEERTLQGIREAKLAFAQDGQVERLARYHGARARWVLDAWIETWMAPDYADWSLETVLPRIKVPVLAMHGQNDEFGSEQHPQMIAALSGGEARMLMMEGIGHMPHREATDQVLAEIGAFADAIG
ncbi:alpha/beta fold hydrolase [Brevundimonas sp.]|uniref:alpha/beta fold hydrolase n=1 Tax=Brevundimonas sp. TaxID=1871086 RepID=UPI002FC70111